ncbi:MAG: hypothetical protein QOE59_1798 [Actinomycetota bacterium]|jgi:hypothetical protein|nr:hypothetical protein [Actinomycetota bacterium]
MRAWPRTRPGRVPSGAVGSQVAQQGRDPAGHGSVDRPKDPVELRQVDETRARYPLTERAVHGREASASGAPER